MHVGSSAAAVALGALVAACASSAPPTQHVTLGPPPVVGHEPNVHERTEPRDAYAARLEDFFHARWSPPSGERDRCVVYQLAVNARMIAWHVRATPVRASGDDAFDASALAMLRRLVDERTALPEPPPESAAELRGRTVEVLLGAERPADPSRCRFAAR